MRRYPRGLSSPAATFHDQAAMRIARAGGRVTRPRVAVYSLLLASPRALAHTDVEAQLARSRQIDRVTVYRVLQWLTERGLAHRIAGEDRVWRFNAPPEDEHAGRAMHPHFRCERCERVLCLDEEGLDVTYRLPRGFRGKHLDVTVHGLCPACRR